MEWHTPLYLVVDGQSHVVASPEHALDWLLHRWPIVEGEALAEARIACSRAFEKSAPGSECRTAFFAAAAEAHLPLE